MGTFTKNGRRARQPRYDIDGLPVEIFSTGEDGEAYVVTEPCTHPVGYQFRRMGDDMEMGCACIDDDLTREQLGTMELLGEGKSPTPGTDLGDALFAMILGLANAAKLAGRPLDEGFGHDEPKPSRKRRTGAKSIQL